MGKITDISQQKKHIHIYNIFVDDTFYCSMSDLDLSLQGLKIGKTLTTQELKKIKSNSELDKTYNRALYYLQYGPRTEFQMKNYLLQKGFGQEYIERVIQKLIDNNYLNDLEYAKNFIIEKQTIKLKSISYIKAHLKKRGIQNEIINKSIEDLDNQDQHEIIKILINKKYKQNSKLHDKQKMTQYLLRQGFIYNDVSKAIKESGLTFNSNKNMYHNTY